MEIAFSGLSHIHFLFFFSNLVCTVLVIWSWGARDDICLFNNCRSSRQVKLPHLNVTLVIFAVSKNKLRNKY